MTKFCPRCDQHKTLAHFNKAKTGRHKRQGYCKDCTTKYLKSKITIAKLIMDVRKAVPCADCKGSFPACAMSFDHLRDKKHQVSSMGTYSVSKIMVEIDKCEVVCFNCHQIRTAERRNVAIS